MQGFSQPQPPVVERVRSGPAEPGLEGTGSEISTRRSYLAASKRSSPSFHHLFAALPPRARARTAPPQGPLSYWVTSAVRVGPSETGLPDSRAPRAPRPRSPRGEAIHWKPDLDEEKPYASQIYVVLVRVFFLSTSSFLLYLVPFLFPSPIHRDGFSLHPGVPGGRHV